MQVVSSVYLFITRGQGLRRSGLEEAEDFSAALKILVVKDSWTKAVFAHVVERKCTDADGYAATRLVEDIRWLGRPELCLKTDNGRAIVNLLKKHCVQPRLT